MCYQTQLAWHSLQAALVCGSVMWTAWKCTVPASSRTDASERACKGAIAISGRAGDAVLGGHEGRKEKAGLWLRARERGGECLAFTGSKPAGKVADARVLGGSTIRSGAALISLNEVAFVF